MAEFCSVIVVAAGNSLRMGAGKSKMFINIGEKMIIQYCLEIFETAPCADEIIVVCKNEDISKIRSICCAYSKVRAVVPGGETRRQSVENGLRAVDKKCTCVAIHDGARPLITMEKIEQVIADSYKYGAAAVAVPVKDTIKVADADGFIESTPERSCLWAVQTPQVFRRDIYEKAIKAASDKTEDVTDDCQLVERLGEKVYLTKGDYTNIKITTPEDIYMAERILKERGIL